MKTASFYTEIQTAVAFKRALRRRLPVVIHYWSPDSSGCKKMEAVTYQDDKVVLNLRTYFVLIRYNVNNLQRDFKPGYLSGSLLWTPTVAVFSPDRTEVRRIVGYLPPHQFYDELEMGRGLAAMRGNRPDDALTIFRDLAQTTVNPIITQEAYYWAGIAAFYAYKKSLSYLRIFWHQLLIEFPDSTWSQRADLLGVTNKKALTGRSRKATAL